MIICYIPAAVDRLFTILAGILGLLAVGLGAFGAHGLRNAIGELPDGAKRLDWWTTAAHYHLTHALALAFVAWLVHRTGANVATWAGWCFVAGIALFSGSLYTMTLTGITKLGAVTPLGGLLLMAGWTLVIATAVGSMK